MYMYIQGCHQVKGSGPKIFSSHYEPDSRLLLEEKKKKIITVKCYAY